MTVLPDTPMGHSLPCLTMAMYSYAQIHCLAACSGRFAAVNGKVGQRVGTEEGRRGGLTCSAQHHPCGLTSLLGHLSYGQRVVCSELSSGSRSGVLVGRCIVVFLFEI